MKHFGPPALLCLCLGTLTSLAGMELHSFYGSGSDQPEPVTFHRFSGQEVRLPVVISWDSETKIALSADLLQVTSGIAAPIEKNIRIADDLPLSPNAYSKLEVAITLPEVKAPSLFVLKLNGTSDASQGTGIIKIHAYPPKEKIMEQFKKLLERYQEKHEVWIHLFGEKEKHPFRHLLEASDAEFKEEGEALPAAWEEGKNLFIGSVSENEANEILADRGHRLPANLHLLLFINDDFSLFPGIYPQPTTRQGARIKICLPLIKQIDDPRTWDTCLRLLQEQLKQI